MPSTDKIKIPEIFTVTKFPSLDGMRAISILLVLFAHLCNAYKFTPTSRAFITQLGLLGVQIFFVISGFLITTLLLKEKSKTQTISLKSFYTRRVFRILPVVFLYLASMVFLNAVFHLGVPLKSFAGALFFLSNLPWFHGSWYTAHFWSLSIEEQYYLLFPFVLKKITTKIHVVIILLLLLIVFIKAFPPPVSFPVLHTLMLFIYQSDGVLVGSLISILCFKGSIAINFFKQCNPLLMLPLAISILLFQTGIVTVLYPLNSTISSFLIGVLLLFVIINTGNLFYRFLNSKYMVMIGKLSFSIYIWQQLFTGTDGRFGSFAHVPKNILLIALAGYVSYNFFEKRFLKMKEKFSNN